MQSSIISRKQLARYKSMSLALVKIERHTFPAVLRTLMDELLLALARLMPHVNPSYTIP